MSLEAVDSNVELKGTEVKDKPKPPTREELTADAARLGTELRALIVLAKRLPRDKDWESHEDPTRSLAIAQQYLQTGFLWLRRLIDAPKGF